MDTSTRLLLILLTFAYGPTYAQTWPWARAGAGSDHAYGKAVAADAQGNCIATGTYKGSLEIGGQTLSTPGEDGVYLAKFDAVGTLLWWHIVANGPGILVNDITVDGGGNIAIVGMYQGSVVFIPGQLGTTLTSQGSFDVFVAKYDGDGSPSWARSIGGEGYDYGASITHDGYLNLIVTGDQHMNAFNLSASKVFVSKFAYNGTPFWTLLSQDYGTAHLGDGIEANDAGELCITGQFFGSFTFGGLTVDAGTPEATIYVARLNSDGAPYWVQKAGAGGYAFGQSVGMDANSNVYITGSYRGTIAFGGLSLPGPADMSYDIFVAKCAGSDGTFQWATHAEGPGHDIAVGIRVDAAGNSYLNGSFQDTWTFGGTTLETNGGVDGYLAKVSADGAPLWAQQYGGPTGDAIGGIDLHGNGIFVTGAFQVDIDFDGTLELTGQPTIRDVFVAKFEESTSGVAEEAVPSFSLYPVPTKDRLSVTGVTGRTAFSIVDAVGRVVRSGILLSGAIDVSALPAGTYQLALSRPSHGDRDVARFVKQ